MKLLNIISLKYYVKWIYKIMEQVHKTKDKDENAVVNIKFLVTYTMLQNCIIFFHMFDLWQDEHALPKKSRKKSGAGESEHWTWFGGCLQEPHKSLLFFFFFLTLLMYFFLKSWWLWNIPICRATISCKKYIDREL